MGNFVQGRMDFYAELLVFDPNLEIFRITAHEYVRTLM